MMMQSREVQTQRRPACPVCGLQGKFVYRGLTDSVFHVPGEWGMKRCNHRDCRTLWLDPMPAEADLIKLYTGYYTHASPNTTTTETQMRALLDRIRTAYLHTHYGYKTSFRPGAARLLSWAVSLYPALKHNLDASVFYLEPNPSGRLLEIGCGNGESLDFMQRMGWHATGLDFDAKAVAVARSKGLDVRLGQLKSQDFDDESFDAIVTRHVIEHLPAPQAFLETCWRILKKGGTMVALTPNADSRLHHRYGQHWIGLEPPRHLQLFTVRSLGTLAERSGFVDVKTFTSMNGFVFQSLASEELSSGLKHVMGGHVALHRRIRYHIMAMALGWAPGWDGEEAVLACRK